MTGGDLHQRVQAYLGGQHVMTLATGGDAGPWAAALFYVHEGFTLYFLSSPATRHCRNLAQRPRVSVTIQQDCSDWPQIKGVQLEGIASRITGKEEQRVRNLYGAKFPVVGKLAQAPAVIRDAFARVSWYQVVADRAYFVDNSAGFGHRDEIDLS